LTPRKELFARFGRHLSHALPHLTHAFRIWGATFAGRAELAFAGSIEATTMCVKWLRRA
jgi:hypothetical protein